MSAPADPARAKQVLRQGMLARRRALEPDAIAAASRRACTRLAAEGVLDGAGSLALYVPFTGEIDPGPLAELAPEARRCYPVVPPAGSVLGFHAVENLRELVPGALGIPAPDPRRHPAVPVDRIDVFVVPGLAFDAHGGRLGFGKGYYDATLRLASSRALRIGLCHAWQVVDRVPFTERDVHLDLVVTDEAVLRPPVESG